MTNSTEKLITNLARELTPSRRLLPTWVIILSWLLVASTYVGVTTALLGPIRPGVVEQLLVPRFGLEMATGFAAIAFAITYAVPLSVPGHAPRLLGMLALLSTVLWTALVASGFFYPSLEPSMLGKRPHCATEAFLYSIPPLLTVAVTIARRYPLARHTPFVWAATASGLLPAVTMQIACMYDPSHALPFHIGPALGLTFGTLAVSVLYARWQQTNSSRVRPNSQF